MERIRDRGSRVRVVGVEEAVAITECRTVLEGLCAASDDQRAELADLGTAMTKAVADGEPVTYSELDQELHARIQEFPGQRTAVDLLERLNAQLVRHRFQLALRPGVPSTP